MTAAGRGVPTASAALPPVLADLRGREAAPVVSAHLYPFTCIVTRRCQLPAPAAAGMNRVILRDLPRDIGDITVTTSRGRVQNVEKMRVSRPRSSVEPSFSAVEREVKTALAALRSAELRVAQAEGALAACDRQEELLRAHATAQMAATPKDGFAGERALFSAAQTAALTRLVASREAGVAAARETAEAALAVARTDRELAQQAADRLLRAACAGSQRGWFSAVASAREGFLTLLNASTVDVTDATVTVEVAEAAADSAAPLDLKLTHTVPGVRWRLAARIDLSTEKSAALSIESTAKIEQRSSEDWENVELALSCHAPNVHRRIPELPSEIVTFAHEAPETKADEGGAALFGAGGGASLGRSAAAAAAGGFAAAPAVSPAFGASATIHLKGRFSLKSSLVERQIPLTTITDVPCTFFRAAVPAKAAAVFVKAALRCAPEQAALFAPAQDTGMAGRPTNASLVLDGAPIGETPVTCAPDGSIYLDIGPDPVITVKVVPVKRTDSKVGHIAPFQTVKREEEITTYLANFNQSTPPAPAEPVAASPPPPPPAATVRVVLLSAVPKSTNSKIVVTLLEPTNTASLRKIDAVEQNEAICEALEKALPDAKHPQHFLDAHDRSRLFTVVSLAPGEQCSSTVRYSVESPANEPEIEID